MNRYLVPLAVLFFVGCNNPTQTTEPAVEATAEEPVTVPTTAELNETDAPVAPAAESPVEALITQPKAPEQPKAEPVQKTAQPAKTDKAPAATKEPVKKAPETPKPTPVAAIDGSVVFAQKCASCHGTKAEKSALGKSQVIAGWSAQQIEDALNGYRDGSYGKEMKGIMQGQAKGLSHDQQSALAKFISAL